MSPSSDCLTPDERAQLQAVRDRRSTEEIAARARVSASTVLRAANGQPLTRAAADAVRRAVTELGRGAT